MMARSVGDFSLSVFLFAFCVLETFFQPAIGQQDILNGCENTCKYAKDGTCDDGGANATHAICRLGTDCEDCGARTVATLQGRNLGFRQEVSKRPSRGVAETDLAVFHADVSFEQCAALCKDKCAAFVRRTKGNNCWLIPLKWYPNGDVELKEWNGGSTYVKLPKCQPAKDSCQTIWNVPCPCKSYHVQNTVELDGYEYASLDDIAPGAKNVGGSDFGARCAKKKTCDGSHCIGKHKGQKYFLKLPCGWDLFPLTNSGNNYQIWNKIVGKGWGAHCINDAFTGASLWSTGGAAGYQKGDVTTANGKVTAIKGECGGMHDNRRFDKSTQTYRGWFMDFSPRAGFRALSCGSRFLIRRPINCRVPKSETIDTACVDAPNANITALVSSDDAWNIKDAKSSNLCKVLADQLKSKQKTCDSTVGGVALRHICCATCNATIETETLKPPPAHVTTHLQLKSVGGNFSTRTNFARDSGTKVIEAVAGGHVSPHSKAGINDGRYGNSYSWSGGKGHGDLYVGYAFSTDSGKQSLTVLVDQIAFGRDNTGAHRGESTGVYTVQVAQATVKVDSASKFEAMFTDNAQSSWKTIGTLIYKENFPEDPWRRHVYKISPPVPITGIRILTSSPDLVIDELEVYGHGPYTKSWLADSKNAGLLVAKRVTDSSSSNTVTHTLINGTDKVVTQSVAPDSSVMVYLNGTHIVYQARFRVYPQPNSEQEELNIRRCKLAFLTVDSRRNQRMMYVTKTSVSADPDDAVAVLDLTASSDLSKLYTKEGMPVNLPVPIETDQIRFYDISGTPKRPIVKVQFGLSGKLLTESVLANLDDPQLDVSLEATGFQGKVGCDKLQYAITVQHKTLEGSVRTGKIRITDFLSDPKLALANGSVAVTKKNDRRSGSKFHPVGSSQRDIKYGNGRSDSYVIVDIDDLLVDEVVKVTYNVHAKDPEPKGTVSSVAVVEMLTTKGAPCQISKDSLCVCSSRVENPKPKFMAKAYKAPGKGCSKRSACGVQRRVIAKHILENDVGTLSFNQSTSFGNDTRPLQVTIDGRVNDVYMITMGFDIGLNAGSASNIAFTLSVPQDRAKYFEFISIDNLDNAGARSAISDDEAVLLRSSVQVLTQSISVPCTNTAMNTGLRLDLTAALFNSFFSSDSYSCTLKGCNELTIQAKLAYDLISPTIYHKRLSNEELFKTIRTTGISLPRATLVPTSPPFAGVRLQGGHPTWPLFTVTLDNEALPAYGYDATVAIQGDFDTLQGRLSMIVSGGREEFFITRNPLAKDSAFGTIGLLTASKKRITTGSSWVPGQVVTASGMILNLRVLRGIVYLSGNIDGHLVSTSFKSNTIRFGEQITVSVYKEIEADQLVIGSLDASFVCEQCTVRHTEVHNVVVPRPGSLPSDIILTGVVQSDTCNVSACVVEGSKEGTKVASLSVADADWAKGDRYSFKIQEQKGDIFRLSTSLPEEQGTVFLEVAANSMPEHAASSNFQLLITVHDNVWKTKFFSKLLTIGVLAHPHEIKLSSYVFVEQSPRDTLVADIESRDLDGKGVTYSLSGFDAKLFKVNGSSLLVAADRMPRYVDQAFFEIVIRARDSDNLVFEKRIELSASDLNECASNTTCVAKHSVCVNSIGGFQCACPPGYEYKLAQSGTPATCVDIKECSTDNGGCGHPSVVKCKELEGSYKCVDIDECQKNNGGCGDSTHVRCVNKYAGPPVCADICECSRQGSCPANSFCTDYERTAVACANTKFAGTSQRASAEATTLSLSGNVAADAEVYVIRSQPSESKLSQLWSSVNASTEASKSRLHVSFSHKTAGNYYMVVRNHGRGIAGSPFKIKVDAASTINRISANGDGLLGGLKSDPLAFEVIAYDAFDNHIFGDSLKQVQQSLKVTVFQKSSSNKAAFKQAEYLGVKSPSDAPGISRSSTKAGVYNVFFKFDHQGDGLYRIVVEWGQSTVNDTKLKLVESISYKNFAAQKTEFRLEPRYVAGDEGHFVMQLYDTSGLPISEIDQLDISNFALESKGPTAVNVKLTKAKDKQGRGLLKAKFLISIAGTYEITVKSGEKQVGSGPARVYVVATDVNAQQSTVSDSAGPFAVAPTVRKGIVGQFMSIVVTARDSFGNANTETDLDKRLQLRMVSQTGKTMRFGACPECNVTCIGGTILRSPSGNYIASYMAKESGRYTLTAEIDGWTVRGMPTQVEISSATATEMSGTTKKHGGHFTAVAGEVSAVPLVFSDQFGNDGAFPGGPVGVNVRPPAHDEISLPTQRNNDSMLEAVFSPTWSGQYNVRVDVSEQSMWTNGNIQVFPGPGVTGAVTVEGSLLGSGVSKDKLTLIAGTVATITITTRDRFNNLASGGSHLSAVLSSVVPGLYKISAAATFRAGVYTVPLAVPADAHQVVGDMQLRVLLNGATSLLLAVTTIAPPKTCTVINSPGVIAAGVPANATVKLNNFPEPANVQLKLLSRGFDGWQEASSGHSKIKQIREQGTLSAAIQKIGTYRLSIVVDGNADLCPMPHTPFVVVSAKPITSRCALTVAANASGVMVGTPFHFQLKGEDKYHNKISIDPFNPTWTPFAVSIASGNSVFLECLQEAHGESLQRGRSASACILDSFESGYVVVGVAGVYTVKATLDGTPITGSGVKVVIHPIPTDPVWDIQILVPQDDTAKVAGSTQLIVARVKHRKTRVILAAKDIKLATYVNMNVSRTCCSYCNCQARAKVSASVFQLDDGVRISSQKAIVAGSYSIVLDLASSDRVTLPAVAEVNAGTPVAQLYSLVDRHSWPKAVEAGALTKFTLVGRDVYGNRLFHGGDLLSTVASRASTTPYIAAGTTVDNNDGTYTVTYRPTLSGEYTVAIDRIGEGSIQRKPWPITVEAGGAYAGTTTLDPDKLTSNATIALFVRDVYGNALTFNDPGIAFTYQYQFTVPQADCGGTGEVCQQRRISYVAVPGKDDKANAAVIDSKATSDSKVTWLGIENSTSTAQVTIALGQATNVDRLRVITMPNGVPKITSQVTVTISLYYSIDGMGWEVLPGLSNGYLNTEFLPDGATLDRNGPHAGGAHIKDLESYVDTWSVMWPSRYMKYLRMDIKATGLNPSSVYPVRELQLFDCHCEHGRYDDSGSITWNPNMYFSRQNPSTHAYVKVLDVPTPLPDGTVSLSVRYGTRPIEYEEGYKGEPYLRIVGSGGDEKTRCASYYQRDIVEKACATKDYCTDLCARELTTWFAACGKYDGDTLGLMAKCQNEESFNVADLKPSVLVPSKSPGLTDGVAAGEAAHIHLLLEDKDGKTTAASSQWLAAGSLSVNVDGPSGSVDTTISLTSTGAVDIQYTPTSAGTHVIVILSLGQPFTKRIVEVTKGRPPRLTAATFTADWGTVLVEFDTEVSDGRGEVQCDRHLKYDTCLLLGAKPSCTWFDASTFEINLGAGARLKAGDFIEIMPNTIARRMVDSMHAQGSITVGLPDKAELPQFCIPDQIVLGSCDNLAVTPACQTGSGGRKLTFEYVAHPNIPGGVSKFKSKLLSARSSLVLDGDLFEPSKMYVFYVRAINYLGVRSTIQHSIRVTKMSTKLLPISIDGAMKLTVNNDDSLFLKGKIGASSSCASFDPKDVKFAWTQSSEADQINFDMAKLEDRNTNLYIPAGNLKPGAKYKFEFQGKVNDLNGTSAVVVSVRERSLVAVIGGGDRIINVNDTVSLDTFGSLDPDSPGYVMQCSTGDTCKHLKSTFRWACKSYPTNIYDRDAQLRSARPCLGYHSTDATLSVANKLTVAPGRLTTGTVYEFSVVVTAISLYSGIKSATAFVRITPVDTDTPTVMIKPPFKQRDDEGNYIWNHNDAVVFVGSATGDRTVAFRWMFRQGGPIKVNDGFSAANRALTMASGSLVPGQQCVLQLEGKYEGSNITGMATLSFIVKRVPRSGTVSVSSDDTKGVGVSLATTYTFTWSNWVGAQFYQLLYRECNSEGCTDTGLTMKSHLPSISTKLSTAVISPTTGVVTVLAKVFDADGSSSISTHNIAVKPNVLNCDQLTKLRDSLRGNLQLQLLGGFYSLVDREHKDGNCRKSGANAIQKQIRWEMAVTNGSECRAELQKREKPLGREWSRWSGTYEAVSCSQTQERIRWQSPAAAGNVQCIFEKQNRSRINNERWSEWIRTADGQVPKFTFVSCSKLESRVAWRTKVTSGNQECQAAEQYRVTVDAESPLPWQGLHDTNGSDYTFDSCTQIKTYTKYEKSSATQPKKCNAGTIKVTRQNGGKWQGQKLWDDAIQSCKEIRQRYRYKTGVVKDAACKPQTQTSSRVHKGSSVSAWSTWSDASEALFESCIGKDQEKWYIYGALGQKPKEATLTVNTITETRKRFRQQVASGNQRCEAETQVRSSGLDGQWGSWTGSFKYISCAEADVIQNYRDKSARKGACTAQTRVAVRECNSAPCEAKFPSKDGSRLYSGDFFQSNCIEFEEKTSWRESGFDVSEEFSGLHQYTCTGSVQNRTAFTNGSGWNAWTGQSLPFSQCDFEVDRTRWSTPVADAGQCVKEVQTRTLIDGKRYTAWSGTFRYEHCMERRSRYIYDKQSSGCKSVVVSGWRLDQSKWFGDAWLTQEEGITKNVDYPYLDCGAGGITQQRIAYKEARPSISCQSEVQVRTRREESWGKWEPKPDREGAAFGHTLCIVEQKRTRWQYVPEEGCRSEVQSRYRLGHDDWSLWTGEFTETTCKDTRVRFNAKEAPWPPVAGSANCTAEIQTMLGKEDGSVTWTGSEEFKHETCEEIQQVARWLAPISWGKPCKRALRARRRPASGDSTAPAAPWGAYGEPFDYIYEHCTQYQSRTLFGDSEGYGMAGDSSRGGVCHAEDQRRKCVDCHEKEASWSLWDGSKLDGCVPSRNTFCEKFKYPICDMKLAKKDSGFDKNKDSQVRTMYQSRTEPCVNETQVRLRLVGSKGKKEWIPWTGDFIYQRCPFSGRIETRKAWNRAAVSSPERCIAESQTRYEEKKASQTANGKSVWSEWIGDFKYTKCTETEMKTFYAKDVSVGTKCVAAKQVRSRVGTTGAIGAWGKWSGEYNFTECLEVAEQKMWNVPESVNMPCKNEIQRQSRRPAENWTNNWQPANYSYRKCSEVTTRLRWAETATSDNCTFEIQNRSRQNEGQWSSWSGKYEFDKCTQTQQRKRYSEAQAQKGKRCKSEIQTRNRINGGNWSDWDGQPKFNYSKCIPGAPTVETRIRWLVKVTTTRCKSEVQQRTVSQKNKDPPWSGSFNYTSCSLVEKRTYYKESRSTSCPREVQSRTSLGTSGDWSKWSGSFKYPNCTQIRTMWKTKDNSNTSCVSQLQTRFADEKYEWTNWTANISDDGKGSPSPPPALFTNPVCLEIESYIKWKESSVECQSEQWDIGSIVLRNPSKSCGKCISEVRKRTRKSGTKDWSALSGTFPYDKCEEVDIRRRYQFRSNQTAAEDACTKASEAQTRTRINNGPWGKWSGTPELIYTYCSVNGTETATKLPDVDTPRIRWYQTNTNDGSCSKETQVRVRTAEGKWGEWSGSYVYSTCADYQTSTRYKYPLSENAACETAVARRQRKDGAEWTPWQSEYNYTTCKHVEKRVAWKVPSTTEMCQSQAQTRERTLPDGKPFTPWEKKYPDFTFKQCIQLATRMRWKRPLESEFDCIGQVQNRSRINNKDWDCWDGSFQFDTCKQDQSRIRFKKRSDKTCEAEVQKRDRESTSKEVVKNGEKFSEQVTLGDWKNKGKFSGTFEYPDCVQPGKQVENRYRYRADGKCTLERQERTRNNGGKWSAWKCTDKGGKSVECKADQMSCVETQTKKKYMSHNNMCVLVPSIRWRAASPGSGAAWTQWKDLGDC